MEINKIVLIKSIFFALTENTPKKYYRAIKSKGLIYHKAQLGRGFSYSTQIQRKFCKESSSKEHYKVMNRNGPLPHL